MDSKLVEGVVGDVLNRHKSGTLDENKIAVLSVEIAAVLDNIISKLKVSKSLSKSTPLDMTMWKGVKDLKVGDTIKQDDWKCKYCNDSMWQVASDYVGNDGNHLSCELEQEIAEEHLDKLKKKESK